MPKPKRPKVPAPGTVVREDLQLVLQSLEKESDRGLVLIGGSLLEELLGELISACLAPDLGKNFASERVFGADGIAGTFSRRIALTKALGLLPPKVTTALDVVRNLRNDGAHFRFRLGSLFTFEDPHVVEALAACPLVPRRTAARMALPRQRAEFICLVMELAATINTEIACRGVVCTQARTEIQASGSALDEAVEAALASEK